MAPVVCRDIKAHEKKIKRAKGRGEQEQAVRLEKSKPRQTLDHLVKERWAFDIRFFAERQEANTLARVSVQVTR